MIIINSKVDGYRRCGVEHPARPTQYPDGAFTEEQLENLSTCDMLEVSRQEEPEPEKKEPPKDNQNGDQIPPDLEKLTVAELKEMANQMNMDIPGKATKKEIIELISAATTGENSGTYTE